uniref:Ig-like domain-containing protein n=1 Tax=Anopheles epiroticus TaxID=199890 RepID=A0A182P8I3_9DIPT
MIPAYQSVHITNLNVPKTYVLDRSTYEAVGSSTLPPVQHEGDAGGGDGGADGDITTGLPMTSTTEENHLLPASVSTVPGDLNITDAGLKPLIMDCQYEIKARECGFVLKWYFNKKLIYQWIPSRTPVGMTNYSMSDSINYKYRALVIRNPKLNHSGEYMCSVQTYDSFDRRMARFQIVVPEKTLLLHYENDGDSDNMLLIKCSVFMIYPEPNLLLIVSGNLFLVSSRTLVTADANHMYNKTVYGKIDKHLLISPTSIGCVLTVPNSGYIRKRETIYYDPTPLTKWSRLRMDERGHFQLLSDDGAG